MPSPFARPALTRLALCSLLLSLAVVTIGARPAAATVNGTVGPLTIAVDPTTVLSNLQSVQTTVTADVSSAIYAVNQRICRTGVDIQSLNQFLPSGGNCSPNALSAGADAYKANVIDPPNQTGVVQFKVGIGSTSWTKSGGTTVTLTCDLTHPCQLVSQLEVPGDTLFFGAPLSYATAAPPTAPSAPLNPTAVGGNAQATVSWTAPASDGGSPITLYTVTAAPGGQTCTWSSGPLSCTVSGLTNGTPYTFTIKATNGVGEGPASTASNTVTPALAGSLFHAIDPARIQDSRANGPQVGPYSTPWAQAQTRDVTVAGVGGVPANADAVVLNVTVTDTSADSFLTIWPAGGTKPLVSSLNWASGKTIPNAVTVKVGAGGKISLYNAAGTVDVIVDVSGYYDSTTGDGYTSLDPARVQDSRANGPQVGPYSTPWAQAQTRDVTVAGVGGVPADADAVVLNVTVTDTSANSFLTIWPAGGTKPLVSSLNWAQGVTIPNAVTVKVGAGGKISLYNAAGTVDVIVDVGGYFKAGSGKAFHAVDPARVQDSRANGPQVGPYSTPWAQAQTRDVTVAGVGGVPADADAVVLNVTVTDTSANSFLTIWPAGGTKPLVSSLNWAQGVTIPNGVTVKVGAGGSVSLYNAAGTVDVIGDVGGYFR